MCKMKNETSTSLDMEKKHFYSLTFLLGVSVSAENIYSSVKARENARGKNIDQELVHKKYYFFLICLFEHCCHTVDETKLSSRII